VECKAKVSDFGHSGVNKDIGNFEIAMDNVLGGQILQSFVHVSDDTMDFGLLQALFSLDFVLQIALIAKLSDDVAVSIARKDLEAAQDVGVVHLFEDFDLGEEEFLKLLRFQRVQLDDLYGHFLV
jgi:hypothetical protein